MRQFKNMFDKASRKSGVTGENLLQLLEARLDNVVYRLGIAQTRRSARQFVGHKHITVNDKIVNIPSFTVKAGDLIAVREKSKSVESITASLTNSSNVYEWITWNDELMQGTFVSIPENESARTSAKEVATVSIGISSSLMPRLSHKVSASVRFIAAVYLDGIETAVTASGPRASTAITKVRAESMPPDNPMTAPLNRFFLT